MNIPQQFDAIRPFEPEELAGAFDRLLANEQFGQVLTYLYPNVPIHAIAQRMHACKTNLEFQKAFAYDFLNNLIHKAAKSCDIDITAISNRQNYTFISNHRDIVLDAAFLAKLLIDADFPTTCEIAIGDNLLSLPWVKDLVRVNKSFIVERGLPFREMLVSSKRLSDYMHFSINHKHENIWIAQREGRAKDADDRTSESVLKMMSMGGEGTITDRLAQLHLVPMTISYEYDPCDYLKAAEFQQKRDNAEWKKGPQDDIISMQTGIIGYKGHIHYHCSACLDSYLKTLDADMPKADIFRTVAAYIDREIHRNYRIYPNNHVAYDLLHATDRQAAHYTAEDKAAFEQYLAQQMAKIDIPNKDEAFLRQCMLAMYANPLINHLAAC